MSLRTAKLQRGCMSERHLDGPGVLRLMRFAPTTLAPGSVFKILQSSRPDAQIFEGLSSDPKLTAADKRSPMEQSLGKSVMAQTARSRGGRRRGEFLSAEEATFLLQMEAEVELWRQTTYKWLCECVKQGDNFPVASEDLADWISRAEAVMPEDRTEVRLQSDEPASLNEELVTFAKQVLARKIEMEKEQKDKTLQGLVTRLYKVKPHKDPSGRRASLTMGEKKWREAKWRFGQTKLDKAMASNAYDFRMAVRRKYPTLLVAWDQMDTNQNGDLDFREFVSACFKVSIAGNLRGIFTELSKDGVSLKLSDLDPTMQEEEEHRKQQRMLKAHSRTDQRQNQLELPPLARLTMEKHQASTGFFDQQAIRSFAKERLPANTACHTDSPLLRQDSAKAFGAAAVTTGEVQYKLAHSQGASSGMVACSGAAFLQAIKQQYQSLERAWDELDMNADGVLGFNEFILACRKLQVRGNLRQMFVELCPQGSRVLKMSDLVPALKQEQQRREQAHRDIMLTKRAEAQEIQKQAQNMWRHGTKTQSCSSSPHGASSNSTTPRHQPSSATSPSSPKKLPPIEKEAKQRD